MSEHAAPAVTYPVSPSGLAVGAMAALWLLAATATLAWVWLSAADPIGLSCSVIGLGLSALALWSHWRAGPRGQLLWDGRSWLWRSRAYPSGTELVRPEIILDAQLLMVLRTCNLAGASWVLCLQRQGDRSAWLDLRRALYARAPAAGPRALGAASEP